MNRIFPSIWISLILLIFCSARTYSQRIENVVSEVSGSEIHIFYDLSDLDDDQPIFIKVFVSTDGGQSYGEVLKSVTGDVGMVMGSGKRKQIIWDVFSEVDELVSESVIFRIRADLLVANQRGPFSNPGYMLGLGANLGKKVKLASGGFNLKAAIRFKQLDLGIRGDYYRSFEAPLSAAAFDNYIGFSGGVFAEYDLIKNPKYSLFPFVGIGQTKIEQQTSSATNEYSGYGTCYSVGAGIDFKLAKYVRLGAEIEYFMAQQIDIDDQDGITVDKIVLDGLWAGITLKFVKQSGN